VAALLAPAAVRAYEAPQDTPPPALPPSFAGPPAVPTAADAPLTGSGVSGRTRVRTDGALGSLTSQIDFPGLGPEARADHLPPLPVAWKREDAWDCPLAGPFAVFGKLNGADARVEGKAGLCCKLGLWRDAAVELRSGPSVVCSEPLRQDRASERVEWLLDVQARWPLLAGVGLEYQGTAAPALTPLDRDRLVQEMRLALPVGDGGKIKIGARRTWESSDTSRAGPSAAELYLGLELFR
jgi:hypothetical protein